MLANKIDICKNTDELKKIILDNPELPIVVLTDFEVVADEGGYWYGNSITYEIKDLIQVSGGYYDDDRIIDSKDDLEDYLSDRLCYEDWANNLSEEDYDNAVKEEMKKYEPLWTKCIVIYSSV